MNKRQQAKAVRPHDRIFPNGYTRDDLINCLISSNAPRTNIVAFAAHSEHQQRLVE